MLGIVGVPVPDELLLTYAGYLIHKQSLSLIPTILFAIGGSCVGITISYLLGRIGGQYVAKRFGHLIGLTAQRLESSHQWFERFGAWLLTFGYFVAGLRHITAFVAGMSKLEWHRFALFAYIGAAIWCISFITLGIVVGEGWQHTTLLLHDRIFYGAVLVSVIILLVIMGRRHFGRLKIQK
jgi:membrane protein DedA with SNARE-associated domain